MSSLIQGYNYDVFISYRQKDNKGDRWVSKFVESLKTELESTFKEDISVYFDENPHDRLQDTHNVDKSLESKLKCLILIPIISQTYCDPKSYAWQSEFLPFQRMAEKDQFGTDVKLRGGNVASRILPIRIHDLEQEDINLYEKETGSVLRAIDFVFKTATGAIRPLLPNEDHPNDNLNKTYYRDQISKVAIAIKEMINAIEHHEPKSEVVAEKHVESATVQKKSKNPTIIAGSIIALAIIILGIFFIPKFIRPKEQFEKSIAVLPFVNLSNNPEQEYFSDGFVEAILNDLFKVGDLKVISSTSTIRYRNTNLSIREIAGELGVNSILEGSIQIIGDNIRITAQLIDVKTDAHIWSEIYDRDISDIFAIQSDVAQRVARELKVALTSEEKKAIEKNETENTEAYNLYLQGRFHIKNRTYNDYIRSIEYFEKAVAVDKDYALAYAGLADAYFLQAYYGQMSRSEAYGKSREYANIALGIDENCAEAHTVLGGILTYCDWNWGEARKELQLALELNPNFISAHSYYSELLDILRENSEARRHIDIVLELDPFFIMMHRLSAILYYHESKFEKALEEYSFIEELVQESQFFRLRVDCYLMQGEYQKAIDELQKSLQGGDTLSLKYADKLDDASIVSDPTKVIDTFIKMILERPNPNAQTLAKYYGMIGNREEALKWLETAFENRSSSIPRVNNDPGYEFLRSEPRFQALIEKMGLSEYQIPK